ncbi:MAG: SpoIIE family protein phosphatase [Bacteriovoracaceae bacterium]|nr:SpoIIE family protein phosphatase [Bacteriovoracaceae bacterium]
MRKIVFPIHIKLIGLTLGLIGLSLAAYVFYAVELFKNDKIAYVFEAVSSQNEQVAQSVEAKIESAVTATRLLERAKSSTKITRQIFSDHPQLIGFIDFNDNARSVFAQNVVDINFSSLKEDLKRKLNTKKSIELYIQSGKTYYIFWQGSAVSLWDKNFLKSNFPESALYNYGLVLGLVRPKDSNTLYGYIKNEVSKKEKMQQTFVSTSTFGKVIVAMDPVGGTDAVVYTSADYQKALEASDDLREKSLFFGLFTAGIAIFLVFLFSKLFTRPIEKLFKASQRFAQNDFDHQVNLKTGDELAVLGDSFNEMASEIKRYMEEMKEKARLENELHTAQLVQNSFFPKDSLSSSNLSLSTFYRPASECGGDWWGYLETDSDELLVMIDVTGHGTAAALVTAVAHNSLTAMKYLVQKDATFLQSPSNVMQYLNESLCSVESSFFATAFVLTRNKVNGQYHYCNASHNPPYLVPKKDDLNKKDFIPLMEGLGSRLGEDLHSKYEDVSVEVSSGDRIVLYTDGLLELEDDKGRSYGNRRFIKKLIEQFPNDPAILVHECVREAFEFAGSIEPKDDITLLCVEVL